MGESLRRNPTEDTQFLETVFKAVLGRGCGSVNDEIHDSVPSVP